MFLCPFRVVGFKNDATVFISIREVGSPTTRNIDSPMVLFAFWGSLGAPRRAPAGPGLAPGSPKGRVFLKRIGQIGPPARKQGGVPRGGFTANSGVC